jgi:hypothetical protein
LLVILSSRIHYASLHICRFLCEVAWLRVKWPIFSHTANTSSCAQGRCCRERGYKFKKLWRWNFDIQLSRTIVDTTRSDSTQPSSSSCASSSLPAQVCAVYELLWPFSLCLVFFHRLSSPSWSLCFSLRIRTWVCILLSSLEFVYYSVFVL